jgi:putative membrane-bound dehydrogenase-like protein
MRLLIVLLLSCGVSLAQESKTHQVKLNGQTFTLPIGFTIEVAAKAPHTLRPVAAAFDSKGRLYVTESSGSNEPSKVQLEKKPHSVLRLEDTDGDGIFDKKTVFADKMMFPQGVMWLDGSLYVGAPPHIWKLTDTNDDGVADSREIWFDGGTLTNCLNDLHGPYPGPDGYIYWTKGAFAKQTHTLGNGKKFESRASHIFRMKPDRTGFDVVMTGGMDNPVDMVFTPKGDIIFSTTFFQHPADGKRDGLIHAIYGGIYGKDHDVIHDPVHKWTSPNTMPVMTHLGPAAPCGLHHYVMNQFGPDYQDNIFCAQFNLRTVSRHVLVPQGSTYRTEDHPFVVSDSLDFHPTDVIEDRDGSLLIVDTGGWYKLCCPTSAIVKDDVHGAIYRVRKVGAHKQVDMPAPPPLPELYYAALNRDASKLPLVKAGLASEDVYTRRLAAHAAGRIGKAEAIPWIVEAIRIRGIDTALTHSLTFALLEIGQPKELLAYSKGYGGFDHIAILMVLDQSGEKIPPELMKTSLDSLNENLRETAWRLLDRHPEHLEPMIARFVEMNNRSSSDKMMRKALGLWGKGSKSSYRLSQMARHPSGQKLLADLLTGSNGIKERADEAIYAMAITELKQFPSVWIEPLTKYLAECGADEVGDVLNLLRSKAPKPLSASLARSLLERIDKTADPFGLPETRTLSIRERCQAIALLPAGTITPADGLLQRLLNAIRGTDAPDLKSLAAEALGMLKLSEAQLIQVAELLPELSPLDFPKVLLAFERNPAYPKAAAALFKAISQPKVRALLRDDQLKALAKNFTAHKPELDKLQTLLDQDRAADRAKVEALLTKMQAGDVRRGQVVFYSQKAACSSCHKIGYVGGLVGPDLSRIGSIRTERDLLEAIVLPSASFVRSYEPVKVTTHDGRVFNGILKSENSSEVVLAINATETVSLKRGEVEAVTPSTVSVMPSGLDQQLTVQDLADLLAFLRSRK